MKFSVPRFRSVLFFAVLTTIALSAAAEANPPPPDQPSEKPNRYDDSYYQEIRNGFLPGLSGSLLKPFVGPKLYQGINFHYAFIQGISQASSPYKFGGYFEWYGEIGFYKESGSAANDDIFFLLALGVNLSFEKRLSDRRIFMVPYFGLKTGGVYFNDRSMAWLIEPVLGAVLIRLPFLNVNYDADLFLNTGALGEFIGVRHSLVVNFNL